MPMYIMLTSLTAEGSKTLTAHPDRVRALNEELQDYGCRVVAQYATLGPYDFVNIVEAPDNESIAVLSASWAPAAASRPSRCPRSPSGICSAG